MYKLVTAPTAAEILVFIPLTDVRYALGKDTDVTDADVSDDTRLVTLLSIAYYNVEKKLGRALLTQTWDYFTNNWESFFELDYTPLASVTHVKYYDGTNTQQTATSGTDYLTTIDVNEVKMINTFSLFNRNDSINIQFVSGQVFGDIAPAIKEGILEEIFGLFFREDRGMRVNEIIHDHRVFVT